MSKKCTAKQGIEAIELRHLELKSITNHPSYGDGYAAALVNFRFMANAVWTTEEVKSKLSQLLASK